MTKQRVHNEWFRTVSLRNRKSCPTCKQKLEGDSIWSWGEYSNARWYTVKHFCKKCYNQEVKPLLIQHEKECGCSFNLCSRNGEKLDFLEQLELRPQRWYKTRDGNKVYVHAIVFLNAVGEKSTFPVKGTIHFRNGRTRYEIWTIAGKVEVVNKAENKWDLVEEIK